MTCVCAVEKAEDLDDEAKYFSPTYTHQMFGCVDQPTVWVSWVLGKVPS
jgi:hypothetical protein